jgi:hypothetical protein
MSTHTKKHIKNTGSRASSELQFADKAAGEEYAEITAPKGSCRFDARIVSTGETVNVPLRGRMTSGRHKQLVKKDDIVLLVKVIGEGYVVEYKYSPEEVKALRKSGELSQVVETSQDTGVTVAFSNEATSAQQTTVIDDDFLSKL